MISCGIRNNRIDSYAKIISRIANKVRAFILRDDGYWMLSKSF